MKRFELGAARVSLALGLALAAGCSGGGGGTDPADADIRVAPIGGPVTEAGVETSFTIVLNAKPKTDVTIDVASSDATEGTVSPASLTFTKENWDAPQTVLVAGVDDAVADGNVSFDVTFTVTSSDSNYSQIELDPKAVLNLDDETAGVRVGPVSGVTSEFGDQVLIPVVLQSEPTADVVLIFGSSDLTEAVTDVITMTFTPLNWNAPQNITVTGEDDEVPDGVVNYSIIFTNALSDDPVYANLPVPAVALGNVDNDSPGFILSPSTALTNETDVSTPSATIEVRLATPPSANVTLSFQVTDTAEGDLQNLAGTGTTFTLTLDPFTATNWNVPQPVRIIGEDDSQADGDQPYNLIISSVTTTDTAYAALARPEVNLLNLDDDSPGILVSPLTSIGDETGGLMFFTIRLATQPVIGTTVTVPMAVSDTSEAWISHDEVTFTSGTTTGGGTWDDVMTVWIAGMPDAIPDGNQPWSVVFSPALSGDPVYAGRKPANLAGFTLDTGVVRRAVVFDDAMGTEADDALLARGWVVNSVSTTADLEAAVDAGTADLVVVESATTMLPASTEASLEAWITGGGKLILSHWDLDATMTLTSALDVAVTPYNAHRFVFPAPIGLMDVFGMTEDFPFPLTGQDLVVDNGQELIPAAGTVLGRVDSLSGPAVIAATNVDRVIVNGFAPDDMAGTDNDGDGVPDMRELYENELAYMLRGGSPVTFDVIRPVGINNPTTSTFVTSPLRVSGVPSAVTDVRVSMHVQHTSNTDLEIFLRGPDGTRIQLMNDQGSGGDDLGTGCRPGDGRITFDDAGLASIPTTGPVVGSYKPSPATPGLSVFDGIDPNGVWQLEVTDDSTFTSTTPNHFGTVKCWSLHLTF